MSAGIELVDHQTLSASLLQVFGKKQYAAIPLNIDNQTSNAPHAKKRKQF